MADSLTPVHENLRRERLARGFKQHQMAEALGISRPSYTDIELGKRRLTAEEARTAASTLRIPITRLYAASSQAA